jgi:hypothetical protein
MNGVGAAQCGRPPPLKLVLLYLKMMEDKEKFIPGSIFNSLIIFVHH